MTRETTFLPFTSNKYHEGVGLLYKWQHQNLFSVRFRLANELISYYMPYIYNCIYQFSTETQHLDAIKGRCFFVSVLLRIQIHRWESQ